MTLDAAGDVGGVGEGSHGGLLVLVGCGAALHPEYRVSE